MTEVSLLASVDEDVLECMIVMDMIERIGNYDELKNEHIERWLCKVELSYRPPTTPDQITTAVKSNVRIQYNDVNPEIWIQSLFIDYVTLLRGRNWDFILEKNTTLAVTHMCSLLGPFPLQNYIETKLSLERKELDENWKEFFDFVVERAKRMKNSTQ